ncbi:hypothetical protein [Streptomyces sp. x-19]|uniref:hypothetical protein n=1 Tax=Streptomyces sp. x-19 TaxID=2789280 RepID=UPI00398037E6
MRIAYCDVACRQRAYRRRVANRAAQASTDRATDPVAELLTALTPFVVRLDGGGLSQVLYKALYRLHVAHVRDHEPAKPLAKLASMNAERVKIRTPTTAADSGTPCAPCVQPDVRHAHP